MHGILRKLVEQGKLPGSFKVPSAGRFGETVRIPLATVLQAEEEWAIPKHSQETAERLPRRKHRGSARPLAHFPELNRSPDAECHEDGLR